MYSICTALKKKTSFALQQTFQYSIQQQSFGSVTANQCHLHLLLFNKTIPETCFLQNSAIIASRRITSQEKSNLLATLKPCLVFQSRTFARSQHKWNAKPDNLKMISRSEETVHKNLFRSSGSLRAIESTLAEKALLEQRTVRSESKH